MKEGNWEKGSSNPSTVKWIHNQLGLFNKEGGKRKGEGGKGRVKEPSRKAGKKKVLQEGGACEGGISRKDRDRGELTAQSTNGGGVRGGGGLNLKGKERGGRRDEITIKKT